MADPLLVQEWLTKAEEDFLFAEANLEEGRNFFPQICFHYQQAAEKYLKAFIVAKEIEFKKIHDLGLLLKMVVRIDPSVEELRDDCEFLGAFYIEARYPVHWPVNFTRDEALKASEAAVRIRKKIKETLSMSIHKDITELSPDS
jgi:HEPN domain-containing protein